MGGDYYERDVITYSNPQQFQEEIKKRGNNKLHPSLDPTRWNDELLANTHKNPIVFALDDTGSMGEWVNVIYDKLPMFYSQIKIQNYVEDPSISFAAIGDHNCCTAPLQVSEFGAGIELDQMVSKLFLEGNGGGNERESYELSAYFYLKRVDLGNCEYPFYFVTGDEGYFDTLNKETVKKFLDLGEERDYNSKELWHELMNKYNVFHLKKPYLSKNYEDKIRKQWEDTLSPERVIVFKESKAVIDVILGLISITSGSRTLEEYLKDMQQRGQSNERLELIQQVLFPYYVKLKSGLIKVVKNNQINDQENLVHLNNISDLIESNLDINDLQIYQKDLLIMSLKPDSIPKEYLCPITKKIMIHPSIGANGECYEKIALEYCLKNKCIISHENILSGKIVPNHALKKLIDNFRLQNN